MYTPRVFQMTGWIKGILLMLLIFSPTIFFLMAIALDSHSRWGFIAYAVVGIAANIAIGLHIVWPE